MSPRESYGSARPGNRKVISARALAEGSRSLVQVRNREFSAVWLHSQQCNRLSEVCKNSRSIWISFFV
jgi:hypothetical protein